MHSPIKERLKIGNFLIRIFLLYSTVAILLLLLGIGVLYSYFKNRSMDDIDRFTRQSLVHASSKMESSISSLNAYLFQLFSHEEVLFFMNSEKKDIKNYIRISNHLNSLMILHPYVESIYIIGNEDLIFKKYNSDAGAESDESIIDLYNRKIFFEPIFRNPEGNKQKRQTLSIVYRNNRDHNVEDGQVIIVNLDIERLGDYSLPDYNDLYIVNYDKEIIIKGKDSPAEEGFIQIIRNYDEQDIHFDTSFPIKISNKEYSASIIKMPFLNSYMIHFNSMSDINISLVETRQFVLIVCLILLPLLMTLFFIISSRIYGPIRKLKEIITQSLSFLELESKASNQDDIAFIAGTIKGTINQIVSMEEKEKNSLNGLRNLFIKEILNQDVQYQKDVIKKKLAEYKISLDMDDSFMTVLLSVDNSDDFVNANTATTARILMLSIATFCKDLLPTHWKVYSFEIEDDSELLILSFKDEDTIHPEDLIKHSKMIQKAIKEYFNLSMSIGISRIFSGFSNLSRAYQESRLCVDYRIVYSAPLILQASQILDLKHNYATNLDMKVYLDNVKAGNETIQKLELESLFDACRIFNYNSIIDFFSRILVELSRLKAQIGEYEHQLLPLWKARQIISRKENRQNLMDFLIAYSHTVYQMLLSANQRGVQSMMEEILSYIQKNFTDPSLSAVSVAEVFSISPQYFSKLFNEYTKTSFPHFIQELRLDKAHDLLVTSELSTLEIGSQVGYFNRSYFTTTFKKKYGVSPSKYRMQQKFSNRKNPGSEHIDDVKNSTH